MGGQTRDEKSFFRGIYTSVKRAVFIHDRYKFADRQLRFPPRWSGGVTGVSTRIDYIFSTATPLRHEVVLKLRRNGKFRNAYRASDHNMVMVDLLLR